MKVKANCPTFNEPLATEYDEGGRVPVWGVYDPCTRLDERKSFVKLKFYKDG